MTARTIARRRLGRTDLEVAELGLGAMDTPTSPDGADTVRTALGLGIDFIDTAREYEGSEYLLGQIVREGGHPSFVVGSKTFARTVHGSQRDVDRSVSMLGLERIDLYQLHDVSTPEAWQAVMGDDGALEGLQIAQYRGLIGHIGISTHDLEIAREAIESDAFDTVMIEYSAFYPQSAPLIDLARDRDVGVIVMRPLGGSGRTSALRTRAAEGRAGSLTPANLLRYVLANEAVSAAIPGARHPSRIRENVVTATASATMDQTERAALEAAAAELY